jgi:hypothetical protein
MAEVDTDFLINQAIQARQDREAQRQGLQAQRDQLTRQLGTLGPRSRGQYRQIQANLANLNAEERQLHSQDVSDNQIMNARLASQARQTAQAHRLSQDATHLEVMRQAGEVFEGHANLISQYAPSSPEYRAGMAALKAQNPLGYASEASKGHLGPLSQFSDQEAIQNQKNLTQALFKSQGLSPQQFASFTNPRATNAPLLGGKDGKTLPTLDEIEKGRANNGANVAFDVNGQTHIMPRGLFENLQSTFTPKPIQGGPVPGTAPQAQQQQVVPRDLPPQGTNYVGSGTATPLHSGDYWTEQLPGGLIRSHFASGGTSTVAAPGSPQSQAAGQLTAARTQYLNQNPQALTVAGGATAGTEGVVQPNLPANLQPVGGGATGTPVTNQLAAQGKVSVTPGQPAAPQQPLAPQANVPTFAPQVVDISQPTAQPAAIPQQAAATPDLSNLPKVGDTRVVGGVTHEWNGVRWDPQ